MLPPATADDTAVNLAEIAIREYEEGDREGAIRNLLKMAYQGNVAAQFNLGVIHGSSDEEIAIRESLYWFDRAGEAGDLGAQYNLGMMLLYSSRSADQTRAFDWLERAAQSGNVAAQVNLGILGIAGEERAGTPEDGLRWLEQAMAAGNPEATALLAGDDTAMVEADPGALRARMLPLDLELRADVERGSNLVQRDDAPVYALPSSRQDPLLALAAGSPVEVMRRENGWVNVRIENGLPGWISADAVRVSGREAEVQTLEAGLYVRPVVDPEVYRIGMVNRGEKLSLLAREPGWYQVNAPARFLGWMRQGDVDLRVRTVRTGIVAGAGPVANMRALPVNPEPLPDSAGAVEPGVEVPPSPTGEALKAPADLTVFADAGNDARSLGRLVEAADVTLESQGALVPLATASAVYGWIHNSLVDTDTDNKVTRNGSRVRLDPDTSLDNIIAVMNEGDIVEILDESGRWLRIHLGEQTGWVSREALSR